MGLVLAPSSASCSCTHHWTWPVFFIHKMGIWRRVVRMKQDTCIKVFSKELWKCHSFFLETMGPSTGQTMCQQTSLETGLETKQEMLWPSWGVQSSLIQCCLLRAGVSHQDVDLGFTDCLLSRLPPTHNESYKVQILLCASNANGEVSSFRLFSLRFLLALSKW